MAQSSFNDGDPIDAAKLAALQTDLNYIKDKIPTIGGNTTTIDATQTNFSNTTVTSTYTPQIYGGITSSVTTTAGTPKAFTINYAGAGLTGNPKAIILTPTHNKTTYAGAPTFYVDRASITPTTATGYLYLPSGYTNFTTYFYYMVIIHN